jgi:hypothetical protein
MLAETLTGAGALATGGLLYAKSRRARLYRELATRIAQITRDHEPGLAAVESRSLPSFADGLAVVPDFLPVARFAALAREAEQLVSPERSFVPAHKQGGTVAYETLIAAAPAIVACYHSAGLRDIVARLVGTAIRPTPINDQSSLSVLVYNKPGDHIGWHYDHNFYRGRHFTVLLAIQCGACRPRIEPCGARRVCPGASSRSARHPTRWWCSRAPACATG